MKKKLLNWQKIYNGFDLNGYWLLWTTAMIIMERSFQEYSSGICIFRVTNNSLIESKDLVERGIHAWHCEAG